MRTQLFTCVCLFAVAAPVSAVNIAWVTFHGADDTGNTPSAAAAGAGHTVAPDKGYTDLLIGAGYAVNRVTVPPPTPDVAPSQALLDELNAADLVIIGRSVNSGSFQQAVETSAWNTQITKPMILTSGFITRDSRLAYTTGETLPDLTGATRIVAVNPAHPVFNGITLNGSNETDVILNIASFNGTPQRGASPNVSPLASTGTLIARITADNAVAQAQNGNYIAEWNAGAASNNAGEVFSSKRMVFFTGSREVDGISGDTAGIMDLTTLGQQLFLNAVAYMGGPATPLVPGDTDGDGIVELEDFNPIRDNFRKTVTARNQGDLATNGRVDFADFRQWKNAFTGGGGSVAGLDFSFASVPEPAACVLMLFGVAVLMARRAAHRTK